MDSKVEIDCLVLIQKRNTWKEEKHQQNPILYRFAEKKPARKQVQQLQTKAGICNFS